MLRRGQFALLSRFSHCAARKVRTSPSLSLCRRVRPNDEATKAGRPRSCWMSSCYQSGSTLRRSIASLVGSRKTPVVGIETVCARPNTRAAPMRSRALRERSASNGLRPRRTFHSIARDERLVSSISEKRPSRPCFLQNSIASSMPRRRTCYGSPTSLKSRPDRLRLCRALKSARDASRIVDRG